MGERLQVERQKFEEEKRNGAPQLPPIMTPMSSIMTENNKSDTALEKGQLDNIEKEQLKISPSTSSGAVSNKPSPLPQKNTSPKQTNTNNINYNKVEQDQIIVEKVSPTDNKQAIIEVQHEQKRLLEEKEKKEKEEEE